VQDCVQHRIDARGRIEQEGKRDQKSRIKGRIRQNGLARRRSYGDALEKAENDQREPGDRRSKCDMGRWGGGRELVGAPQAKRVASAEKNEGVLIRF
jgi:hypothetical protein